MRAVSRHGSWTEWCAFFLKGVIDQACLNQRKAENIIGLYRAMLEKVREITHSQYSSQAVDFLFSQPVFDTSGFRDRSGIPKPTANRIIEELSKNKIIQLVSPSAGRKPSIYMFFRLIAIAEGISPAPA